MIDALKKDNELLANIKSHLPELTALLQEMNSPWFYEDPIYRFYHQSFEVYALQSETKKIVDALKSLAPGGATFCKEFEEIYSVGASGKQFEMAHNQNWTTHTRVFFRSVFTCEIFLGNGRQVRSRTRYRAEHVAIRLGGVAVFV